MNKHGVLLDMLQDKILFVPGRCDHDGNAASAAKNFNFLPPKAPMGTAVDQSDPEDNPPPRIA